MEYTHKNFQSSSTSRLRIAEFILKNEVFTLIVYNKITNK